MRCLHALPLLALLVGCESSPTARPARYTPAQIDRGRYLVNSVAYCGFCHTAMYPDGTREQSRLLAGIDCIIDRPAPGQTRANPDDGYGCLSFTNLTNDATGIGERTDEELKAATFDGVRHDGTAVSTVHPYYLYALYSEPDRDAVVAYMRSLPPVELPTRREPPWTTAPLISVVTDAQLPTPSPAYPEHEAATRGRYLAAIAACSWCHTPTYPSTDPRAATDVIQRDRIYQGGRGLRALSSLGYRPGMIALDPPVSPAMWSTATVFSTNLTPDPGTGLGSYSAADFTRVMHEGKDPAGKYSCAAAHGDPTSISASLTDGDVLDLYHYFRSLPPATRPVPSTCEAFK